MTDQASVETFPLTEIEFPQGLETSPYQELESVFMLTEIEFPQGLETFATNMPIKSYCLPK